MGDAKQSAQCGTESGLQIVCSQCKAPSDKPWLHIVWITEFRHQLRHPTIALVHTVLTHCQSHCFETSLQSRGGGGGE